MIMDQEVADHLPNRADERAKYPDRDFFFGILQCLRPTYCEHIVKEAQKQRAKQITPLARANSLLSIGLNADMARLLLKYPY